MACTAWSQAARRLPTPDGRLQLANSIQHEGMAMTESTDYVANGLYLIAAGIVLTCGFWFFRSERQVTRTVNALIRGRFTGYGEQDRAQMVKGMRLRPRSVSAWASSSYSWVSRLWSGDVTGDAVSYLSDYRRDAQTTCCLA